MQEKFELIAKIVLGFIALLLLAVAYVVSRTSPAPLSNYSPATENGTENTYTASYTSAPTKTPVLSPTPFPTRTPAPTSTSIPSSTPTPTIALVTLRPSNPENNLTWQENNLPGISSWQVSNGFYLNLAESRIAGFADASSVNIGEDIHLAISTKVKDTKYSLAVYRMGWYNRSGARKVFEEYDLTGQPQGFWNVNTKGIIDCSTCEIDPTTGLIDTHWTYNYTLTVPTNWASGLYMVLLMDQDNYSAYIPFVVRDDQRQSDILVQIPINTYQANNQWGGNSLFSHLPGQPAEIYGSVPAVKVSFNRPYHGINPSTFNTDIQLIHFLERYGFDVTYTTSVDIDRDPSVLLRHRAFLDAGQDLLWTKSQRDAVEYARDAGINLAFFGSNTSSTQVRLEPDRDGKPQRVLTLYRSVTADPMSATDPQRVTGAFNAPPISRPQNSLLGLSLVTGINSPLPVDWVVSDQIPEKLLANTNYKTGDHIKDLIGSQCNAPTNDENQPQNLVMIGSATYSDYNGKTSTCYTSLYQSSSGSGVFYAGSTNWTLSIDPTFNQYKSGIAVLTLNILSSFGIHFTVP